MTDGSKEKSSTRPSTTVLGKTTTAPVPPKEKSGRLLVDDGSSLQLIKDVLTAEVYEVFLNELARMTSIKRALLDKQKFPVSFVRRGDNEIVYSVNFGGVCSQWSIKTGFKNHQDEVKSTLKRRSVRSL